MRWRGGSPPYIEFRDGQDGTEAEVSSVFDHTEYGCLIVASSAYSFAPNDQEIDALPPKGHNNITRSPSKHDPNPPPSQRSIPMIPNQALHIDPPRPPRRIHTHPPLPHLRFERLEHPQLSVYRLIHPAFFPDYFWGGHRTAEDGNEGEGVGEGSCGEEEGMEECGFPP